MVAEKRVVVVNGGFALRVVQRERTQILCLVGIGTQNHVFRHAAACHDSEIVVEETGCIESFGHRKFFAANHRISHSVE